MASVTQCPLRAVGCPYFAGLVYGGCFWRRRTPRTSTCTSDPGGEGGGPPRRRALTLVAASSMLDARDGGGGGTDGRWGSGGGAGSAAVQGCCETTRSGLGGPRRRRCGRAATVWAWLTRAPVLLRGARTRRGRPSRPPYPANHATAPAAWGAPPCARAAGGSGWLSAARGGTTGAMRGREAGVTLRPRRGRSLTRRRRGGGARGRGWPLGRSCYGGMGGTHGRQAPAANIPTARDTAAAPTVRATVGGCHASCRRRRRGVPRGGSAHRQSGNGRLRGGRLHRRFVAHRQERPQADVARRQRPRRRFKVQLQPSCVLCRGWCLGSIWLERRRRLA